MKNLDDTQSMPPVSDETQVLPRTKSGKGTVRELDPLPTQGSRTAAGGQPPKSPMGQGTPQPGSPYDPEGPQGPDDPQKKAASSAKRKRNVIFAIGFVIAVLLGFIAAGYSQQSAERAENQRQHQEQQLQSQQAKIDKDTKDLEAKKAQLEQQKQELAKKKQELEQQSARAQGRNEQLASDESSGIGKLIDKVTGKDAKRQQAKAANDAEQSAAQSDAGSVDQSLENVQQMLDDVDQKLDPAKSVKQDASAALEKAPTAYDEHRGTIDAVVSYAKTGAQMLGNLLFQ